VIRDGSEMSKLFSPGLESLSCFSSDPREGGGNGIAKSSRVETSRPGQKFKMGAWAKVKKSRPLKTGQRERKVMVASKPSG